MIKTTHKTERKKIYKHCEAHEITIADSIFSSISILSVYIKWYMLDDDFISLQVVNTFIS